MNNKGWCLRMMMVFLLLLSISLIISSFYVAKITKDDEENNISVEKSLNTILEYLEHNNMDSINGVTKIIIVPGYKFRIVDKIITNFHQPKSTLLLLISAFVGANNWTEIYDYALNHNFRFLSYGDSSILMRGE